MAAGSTVVGVGVLVHAARATRGSGAIAGRAALVVRARSNLMRARGAAIGGRAARRCCNVDTSVAAGTGVLSSWARPVTCRILCDACSVTVLWKIRGAARHAGRSVATHRTVVRRLACVGAFGETAGCLIVIAHADATAIVVVGVAANRAGATLTNRSSVRIRRALLALQATGVGIVIGRARIAALVIPGTAGERAGSSGAAAIARSPCRLGARGTQGAAGVRTIVRRANTTAVVRA